MRARENPFRTERLERLAFRHEELSLATIQARWIALGRRGAVVGPRGSGKTTLLRELAARTAGEGFRVRRRFLGGDGPPPSLPALLREASGLGADDVLLFDGAGHLPRWEWRLVERLARNAGGLLVTAHAPGLLPTLVETRTDPELLGRLVGELGGAERDHWQAVAAALFDACGGNLRDVFLTLYDVAARESGEAAPRHPPSRGNEAR